MPTVMYPPPDPSAVYWRREKNSGQFEYASIQSMTKDDHGNWKALFLVPGQAPFYITQYDSHLRDWEPIFALTEKNMELIVEKIAQKVTAILSEKGHSPGDIVPAAMEVVQQESVEEAIEVAVEATTEAAVEDPPSEDNFEAEEAAITATDDPDYYISPDFKKQKKDFVCGVCEKHYAYEKSLRKHITKEHNILGKKIAKYVQ